MFLACFHSIPAESYQTVLELTVTPLKSRRRPEYGGRLSPSSFGYRLIRGDAVGVEWGETQTVLWDEQVL